MSLMGNCLSTSSLSPYTPIAYSSSSRKVSQDGYLKESIPRKPSFKELCKIKLVKLHLLHLWMNNVRPNIIFLFPNSIASFPHQDSITFIAKINLTLTLGSIGVICGGGGKGLEGRNHLMACYESVIP